MQMMQGFFYGSKDAIDIETTINNELKLSLVECKKIILLSTSTKVKPNSLCMTQPKNWLKLILAVYQSMGIKSTNQMNMNTLIQL